MKQSFVHILRKIKWIESTLSAAKHWTQKCSKHSINKGRPIVFSTFAEISPRSQIRKLHWFLATWPKLTTLTDLSDKSGTGSADREIYHRDEPFYESFAQVLNTSNKMLIINTRHNTKSNVTKLCLGCLSRNMRPENILALSQPAAKYIYGLFQQSVI